MAFPLCQPVTRQQYNRLCAHASQQPDFIFLGSQAPSGGRGEARGFSCLAVEQAVIDSMPNKRIDTPTLAGELEALADTYRQETRTIDREKSKLNTRVKPSKKTKQEKAATENNLSNTKA